MIRVDKSVYASKETSDGKRILVMTLWPRGVSKDKVDDWMKELGTPRDLIKKYKGGSIGWAEFASGYKKSPIRKGKSLKGWPPSPRQRQSHYFVLRRTRGSATGLF
jgi:uncharacterized protein YeaO (DUF488 family)